MTLDIWGNKYPQQRMHQDAGENYPAQAEAWTWLISDNLKCGQQQVYMWPLPLITKYFIES